MLPRSDPSLEVVESHPEKEAIKFFFSFSCAPSYMYRKQIRPPNILGKHDSFFRLVLIISASMYETSRLSSSKPQPECYQDQMPFINEGWLDSLNQVAVYKKFVQFLE